MGSFHLKQKIHELNINRGATTLKKYEKSEEELTCRFKIDIRNLTNVDSRTQKSQKFTLYWAAFDLSISCLSRKMYRGVTFHDTRV